MMIRNPATQLEFFKSKQLTLDQDHETLLMEYVDRWWQSNRKSLSDFVAARQLPIGISVADSGPRHSGFGSGTQFSMSVAAGLNHVFKIGKTDAEHLAAMMNRGKRSAIGTHGFLQGGFLVDKGLSEEATLSELVKRCDFPDDWRIVLFLPKHLKGMHGKLENKTFDELVHGRSNYRNELIDLCHDHIVPAIEHRNYAELGDPLFEFNRLSGAYFCDHQFGCYHSETCAQIVEDLRAAGIQAVGQSSWGPCIFAICSSVGNATEIVSRLQANNNDFYCASNIDIIISEPDNSGFRIIEN